jgi:hypothetical protein
LRLTTLLYALPDGSPVQRLGLTPTPFSVDVLACQRCHGRLKLLAMVTDAKSIVRFLRKLGEPTEPPARLPARAPPY